MTDTASAPTVSVAPLVAGPEQRLGLLTPDVTGLPPVLWQEGADSGLLEALGAPELPASQSLLLALLLTEATGPEAWLLTRIDRLTALGAVTPARELALQAGPGDSPEIFRRWFDLSLLTDAEDAPCAMLTRALRLSSDRDTQIYCIARQGDVDTAALLYGTAAAVGLLDQPSEALLARFLDPDLYGPDSVPPPPLQPDPLTFRLYEAAGAPLSPATLPRAFANAGLRAQSGWKQQLTSAERLARAGVFPAEPLIALYSDRRAAASGGIWDRVTAVQRLQRALASEDAETVAATLPRFWRTMRRAGLAVPVAGYFASTLTRFDLAGEAAETAFYIQALSANPAQAKLPLGREDLAFLHSLATGQPDPARARNETERAIARAFASPSGAPERPQQLGADLLRLLARLEQGAEGDTGALFHALSGLRAKGQADTATRAALQILILRDAR